VAKPSSEIGWAGHDRRKAGAPAITRYGHFMITCRGKVLLRYGIGVREAEKFKLKKVDADSSSQV
jgi:hypothetical protein